MESIAVIGAGTMGTGIAETAARAGLRVNLFDVSSSQREQASKRVETSLQKAVQRSKLSQEEAQATRERIVLHSELAEAVADAGFVIEAAVEQEEVKCGLFSELDRLCAADVVLASNTSSISITLLGAKTGRPDKVVGMHFFNPVPVMKPVEIVRGLATSEETVNATQFLADRLGKEAFTVKDSPGFVVNRILMPLINEAIFSLQEGIADARTIDSLMKLGCNHPMGPLELADFVGLDVCLWILQVLHRELGDPKFRPCPLLKQMVQAGRLGRKSGQGFYTY